MSFTIYLKPEAIREYMKWQDDHENLSEQIFLWTEARLRLVNQSTTGWVSIQIGIDEWHQILDSFDNLIIFKH